MGIIVVWNIVLAHLKKCEIIKHGLGKEDLKQAAEEMALLKADMNREAEKLK